MQLVNRMYVDADFSSAKVGQAAAECVDREALVRYLPVACCKDVVVYAADEDGRLDGDIGGGEIQAQMPFRSQSTGWPVTESRFLKMNYAV